MIPSIEKTEKTPAEASANKEINLRRSGKLLFSVRAYFAPNSKTLEISPTNKNRMANIFGKTKIMIAEIINCTW